MLGTAAIKDYGEAKQYERTLLDALIPAANVAERDGTLQQAAKAASTGCESTRHMKGNHGRSGHVRACVLRDYEDAGARMVCVILDELIKVNLIP